MIINFLESLIASYFFTNYFDLKINKYVYFIINFVFISSEINIFSYFYDFSVILPLLVVLTATVKSNQRIIAGNAQFAGIAAGRGVRFTTGLLLLGKGLGMRETPIRPHSWH